MNVFYCTTFSGYWPVGTAAIVAAPNADEAADLLMFELLKHRLGQTITPQDMKPFNVEYAGALILRDGDY